MVGRKGFGKVFLALKSPVVSRRSSRTLFMDEVSETEAS